MSTESFRAAVFAEIETFMSTNHPDINMAWENGPEVDEASVTKGIVEVELRFYSASLAEVGANSANRHTGAIALWVYTRQTSGTEVGDLICDGLARLLKQRRLGSAMTRAPQRLVPSPAKGWYRTGVTVPFLLDVR